jgi:hypothetical protein
VYKGIVVVYSKEKSTVCVGIDEERKERIERKKANSIIIIIVLCKNRTQIDVKEKIKRLNKRIIICVDKRTIDFFSFNNIKKKIYIERNAKNFSIKTADFDLCNTEAFSTTIYVLRFSLFFRFLFFYTYATLIFSYMNH